MRRLIERLNARRVQGAAASWSPSSAPPARASRRCCGPACCRGSSATGATGSCCRRFGRDTIPSASSPRAAAEALGKPDEWRALARPLRRRRPRPRAQRADRARCRRAPARARPGCSSPSTRPRSCSPSRRRRRRRASSASMKAAPPTSCSMFIGLITLRSDYLGQLQVAAEDVIRFEEFSLGPLPLNRIRQIIEGPARVAGLKVEEGLIAAASADAGTEDALPLLAFTLRELYDRYVDDRDGGGAARQLSLVHYAALGDTSGGLNPLENSVRKRADEVLAEANPSPEDLQALREAFIGGLVWINSEGEYSRRPARLDQIPEKARPILQKLEAARLVIFGEEGGQRTVEVAHESLLRKWPRLRGWLDEERDFLLGRMQLDHALADWQKAAEADKRSALVRGLLLGRARQWLVDHPRSLDDAEKAFIAASVAEEEAEKRRGRRLRNLLIAGAAAVVAIVIVAGGVVFMAAAERRDRAARSRGGRPRRRCDAARLRLARPPPARRRRRRDRRGGRCGVASLDHRDALGAAPERARAVAASRCGAPSPRRCGRGSSPSSPTRPTYWSAVPTAGSTSGTRRRGRRPRPSRRSRSSKAPGRSRRRSARLRRPGSAARSVLLDDGRLVRLDASGAPAGEVRLADDIGRAAAHDARRRSHRRRVAVGARGQRLGLRERRRGVREDGARRGFCPHRRGERGRRGRGGGDRVGGPDPRRPHRRRARGNDDRPHRRRAAPVARAQRRRGAARRRQRRRTGVPGRCGRRGARGGAAAGQRHRARLRARRRPARGRLRRHRHLRLRPRRGRPRAASTGLAGHSNTVLGIAWNEAGDAIASSSVDGSVKYWTVDARRPDRLRARCAGRVGAHRPRPVARRPLPRRGRGGWRRLRLRPARPPSPGRCRRAAMPRCARSAGARTSRGWRRSTTTASSPSANWPEGEVVEERRIDESVVESVRWLPDGKALVVATLGGAVRLWPLGGDAGRFRRAASRAGAGARRAAGRRAAGLGRCPRQCLAVGHRGAEADRERLDARPTRRWTPSSSTTPAPGCWSPAMAASSISTTSSRPASRMRIDLGSRQIDGAAWSPDDALIAAVDTEGNLKVWSLAEGKLMVTARIYRAGPPGADPAEEDEGGHLRRMLWLPDLVLRGHRHLGGGGGGGDDRPGGVAHSGAFRLRDQGAGRGERAGGRGGGVTTGHCGSERALLKEFSFPAYGKISASQSPTSVMPVLVTGIHANTPAKTCGWPELRPAMTIVVVESPWRPETWCTHAGTIKGLALGPQRPARRLGHLGDDLASHRLDLLVGQRLVPRLERHLDRQRLLARTERIAFEEVEDRDAVKPASCRRLPRRGSRAAASTPAVEDEGEVAPDRLEIGQLQRRLGLGRLDPRQRDRHRGSARSRRAAPRHRAPRASSDGTRRTSR